MLHAAAGSQDLLAQHAEFNAMCQAPVSAGNAHLFNTALLQAGVMPNAAAVAAATVG